MIIIPYSGGLDSTALLFSSILEDANRPVEQQKGILAVSIVSDAIDRNKQLKEFMVRQTTLDNIKNDTWSTDLLFPGPKQDFSEYIRTKFREQTITINFEKCQPYMVQARRAYDELVDQQSVVSFQTPLWGYAIGSMSLPGDEIRYGVVSDDGLSIEEFRMFTDVTKSVAATSGIQPIGIEQSDNILNAITMTHVHVTFPLANTAKHQLIRFLKSITFSDITTAFDHIWYCQSPKSTKGVSKPCNRCTSCDRMATAMWEFHREEKRRSKEDRKSKK